MAFMYNSNLLSPWRNIYLKYAIKKSAGKAQRIIAISNSTRDDLMRFYNIEPERIRVIYSGVDERFKPADLLLISAFKEKKSLPNDFILFLGDLEKRKNIPLLLEAFSILTKEMKIPVKLVIAGKPSKPFLEFLSIIERKDLKEDILLPGYIEEEDLPLLFSSASLFVYPSLYEGFGLPLLEAMACGIPVIASNCSSIPEVTGDAALLLSSFEPYEWAYSMRDLILDRDKKNDFIEKGLKRVKDFSWDKTARKTLAVYEEFKKG